MLDHISPENWFVKSFVVVFFLSPLLPLFNSDKMILISALFIVSICYLYTTGFKINNLAMTVLVNSLLENNYSMFDGG